RREARNLEKTSRRMSGAAATRGWSGRMGRAGRLSGLPNRPPGHAAAATGPAPSFAANEGADDAEDFGVRHAGRPARCAGQPDPLHGHGQTAEPEQEGESHRAAAPVDGRWLEAIRLRGIEGG